MPNTTYVDYKTPTVNADWLNEVNDHLWTDTPVVGTTVHDASKIKNTPSGTITSTNVQSAINEMDANFTNLNNNKQELLPSQTGQNGKVLGTDGTNLIWTIAASTVTTSTWGSITGTLSDQTDLNTALGLKADTTSLSTVATTGSYNDLSNKPTIPAQFNPIAGTNITLSGTYPNITFNASGSGGSMTYPSGTGIAVVTSGTSWGTTLAAPTGAIVGTSDVQALTNKSYNGNTWTAGTGTLTLAAGKTLTANNTLTLAGTDGTTMTFPAENASVGFRNVPQNSQSAAYTCVLTDSGKHILHPSADTTARTFTIPANASVAYPIGTAITFVNQNAAGVVTIAITADVMRLAGAGTTGSRTLAANGVATALKITTTEWIISGTGLT